MHGFTMQSRLRTTLKCIPLLVQTIGANCECNGRVWRMDVGMSKGVLNARPQVCHTSCLQPPQSTPRPSGCPPFPLCFAARSRAHTCVGVLCNMLLRLLCGMHCSRKACSSSAGAGDRASRCEREHKSARPVAAYAGAAAPATCHGHPSQPLPYLMAALGAQVCPDQRMSAPDVGWKMRVSQVGKKCSSSKSMAESEQTWQGAMCTAGMQAEWHSRAYLHSKEQ